MRPGVLVAACITLGGVIVPAANAAASPEQGQVNTTSTTTASSGHAGPDTYHAASVDAKLVLDHTTVRAGSTVKGTWIFTNTTSEPILVDTCASDIWDGVGLQSQQIAAATTQPLTPELMCSPSVDLSPGVNRFPVRISTSFVDYGPCYSPSSTKKTPMCHALTRAGRTPPLPPGKYTTNYLIRGMPADFEPPAPLTITLRPSRLLPHNDGIVIGTATPCVGIEVNTGLAHTSTVHVRLDMGRTVVASRAVSDTVNSGGTLADQPFMFTDPAGKYVAVGPGGSVHLVIQPGKATRVTIPNGCFQ